MLLRLTEVLHRETVDAENEPYAGVLWHARGRLLQVQLRFGVVASQMVREPPGEAIDTRISRAPACQGCSCLKRFEAPQRELKFGQRQ